MTDRSGVVLSSQPVTELIRRRFSCRRYLDRPIRAGTRQRLAEFLAANTSGPLGAKARFMFAAATEEERGALRGLGTYGTIHNPAGFIIGAVGPGDKNLEDFGFLMERAILLATGLDVGTCWLGGFFTRSTFARAIGLTRQETLPAVAAAGYVAEADGPDLFRRISRGDSRLPWDRLFFEERFGEPMSPQAAGGHAEPLEMVRLAPSASNRQPWRIVRVGDAWHFYIHRLPGYRNNPVTRLMNIVDLQRVDLGIAMCHWQLTCAEMGLPGEWQVRDPGLARLSRWTEYVVTWAGARNPL